MNTIPVNGYFAGTIAGHVAATIVSATEAELPNGERFTIRNGSASVDWQWNEETGAYKANGLLHWENGHRKATSRSGMEQAEVA